MRQPVIMQVELSNTMHNAMTSNNTIDGNEKEFAFIHNFMTEI